MLMLLITDFGNEIFAISYSVVNHCSGHLREQYCISIMVPVGNYFELNFISNRVLSCLMENLHTDNMIPECEEQLLHLEFFIARDFKYEVKVAFLQLRY